MIEMILNIAKVLNLNVVAEGVENVIQKEYLLSKGCHILQGYYFSKPITKSEFESYISNIELR